MGEFDLSEYVGTKQETESNLQMALDEYKDSELVQYAIREIYSNVKSKEQIELLTRAQRGYIELMQQRMAVENMHDLLEIDKTTIVIWKRTNKLFAKCLELIKESQAESVESLMWMDAANKDNKDNITRMFLIKARKPEYRENAVVPASSIVNVRVTIDSKDYDSQSVFTPNVEE